MTEKELGKALLELDSANLAGVPEARQQTWKIIERDRRRVRLLAGLAVAVWLLAVFLIFLGMVNYGLLFPRIEQLRQSVEAGKEAPAHYEQVREELGHAFQKSTFLIALSVLALTGAAFCTVLLVFSSRRATLRQVNASLAEISEQLKQLRQALAR